MGLDEVRVGEVIPSGAGGCEKELFGYQIVLFLMKGWTLSRPMDGGLESIYNGFLALPNRDRHYTVWLILGLN